MPPESIFACCNTDLGSRACFFLLLPVMIKVKYKRKSKKKKRHHFSLLVFGGSARFNNVVIRRAPPSTFYPLCSLFSYVRLFPPSPKCVPEIVLNTEIRPSVLAANSLRCVSVGLRFLRYDNDDEVKTRDWNIV